MAESPGRTASVPPTSSPHARAIAAPGLILDIEHRRCDVQLPGEVFLDQGIEDQASALVGRLESHTEEAEARIRLPRLRAVGERSWQRDHETLSE